MYVTAHVLHVLRAFYNMIHAGEKPSASSIHEKTRIRRDQISVILHRCVKQGWLEAYRTRDVTRGGAHTYFRLTAEGEKELPLFLFNNRDRHH